MVHIADRCSSPRTDGPDVRIRITWARSSRATRPESMAPNASVDSHKRAFYRSAMRSIRSSVRTVPFPISHDCEEGCHAHDQH